jgi:hypothetical protein
MTGVKGDKARKTRRLDGDSQPLGGEEAEKPGEEARSLSEETASE